jgi:23S rRNA pseudouridine1911/1915/1917 synthase
MPDRTVQLVVEPEEAGSRLDRFLAARLPDLSRSAIQRLIAEGLVQVSAGAVKPSLNVAAGLAVDLTVPAPIPATPEPEDLPLTVLYDDADLVVVDKAPGIVVHPAAGHARGTLVNALLHHVGGLSGVGGVTRPGIVHRLDRGTSGVMMVAKHDQAHRELARQFREREVTKEYLALVWGRPGAGQAIDLPIGRDPRHRRKMSSRARRARSASTRIVDIEPLGGVSLIRVAIGTGRTHQIRVHLSEIGHAIVGDALYGGVRRTLPARLRSIATLGRPFLHAARLTITHPRTGGAMTFEAPLARDLADVLTALRQAQPARTGDARSEVP